MPKSRDEVQYAMDVIDITRRLKMRGKTGKLDLPETAAYHGERVKILRENRGGTLQVVLLDDMKFGIAHTLCVKKYELILDEGMPREDSVWPLRTSMPDGKVALAAERMFGEHRATIQLGEHASLGAAFDFIDGRDQPRYDAGHVHSSFLDGWTVVARQDGRRYELRAGAWEQVPDVPPAEMARAVEVRKMRIRELIVAQLIATANELHAMADALGESGDMMLAEPSSYAVVAKDAVQRLMVHDQLIDAEDKL